MKTLYNFAAILVTALSASVGTCAQGPFSEWVTKAGDAPFIIIDKQELSLTLVDALGTQLAQWRIAAAENIGNKTCRGDHKTPEGTFKITQLLDARGLPHDFGDGKGPIPNAYGPWFLRLGVPGYRDIGIHGTPFPESIGTRATEGCIRMRNEDVVELKKMVKVGTPVIILPDPV